MPQAVAAAAVWVGNTAAAVAGSVSVAAGANWAAVVATKVAVFNVVSAVSSIALYTGMQYAIDAVSRPKIKPPGSELTFNIDPDYPREMIIGQRMVGGSMVARYSRGTNLYNAHMVIQVADHPCVELSKVYDAGRLVRDTALTHGTRTEITAYSNSGGARVWMTWHDGRPGQTADSDLITKSALDPEVVAGKIEGWTSNHVGAGCAYVHVEVQWDSDILTSIPQFQFLVKGAKLYDRRLDTTAGGSGSHRLNDPSTWSYSTNAMVALDHFLLGYQVEDDPLAFGIGLSPTEVPYAQFEAAADLCDEDVETGVGGAVETIKRYAVNGVISAGDYFEDVVEAMQLQMAARVVDLGGRIGILGAEERAITVSLSEDDLVGGEPLQFADKLQFTDLIGTVTGTFSDPANNYQPSPYAPLVSAYAALPDGGEAQATTLPFPYEVHPRRVVRLASAWLERESLQPRLAGVFMPKAWKLEPGDWFEFTSARLQVEAAKFEVIDIVKNDDFTVTMTARAIDPAFLAFDNDNDPDLSVPPEVAPVSRILATPTFTPSATTISGGGATEPVIQVVVDAPNPVTRELIIEVREWNGTALTGPSLLFVGHADDLTTILRQGLKPDTAYKIRMKARAGSRESGWSEWSSAITMSSTYIVPAASSAAPGSDLDVDFSAAIAAAAAAAASATASASHATNAALAETNAETAQTAAEAALTGATTQATNAASSATTAAGAATAASGSASAAAGSATSASNSATSASGSATAAASSASAAAASASSAAGSASAASTSASSAATQASNAATSASAAQTSLVAAKVTAAAIFPATFERDGAFFTAAGDFNPTTDLSGSFNDVAVEGRALSQTGGQGVAQKGRQQLRSGRTYSVTARLRIQTDATNGYNPQPLVGLVAFTADGTYLGGTYWTAGFVTKSVADGWMTLGGIVTAANIAASTPTAAFIRAYCEPCWNGTGTSNAVAQITQLNFADVTESTTAAGSASAAASSASSAAASQSAAASSASAASTSATNAATSASNASTSASNASTSETNAAGSASTASTAATNAASSQSAAAGSASAASSSASTASTQASNAATSASAASTSATNAATQASNASTSAGAASTSAGNAAASATTASTQASNAAGSASSASSSASSASASATAASNSATLSATYAAGSQGSINSSATFADNANATGIPTNWFEWTNAAADGTRQTGIAPQPYAYQQAGRAGENGGIYQPLFGRFSAGWHVIEADITLVSGALTGAGVLLNADPASVYTEYRLIFSTDADVNGSVVGAGTTGVLYKFRKLVQVGLGVTYNHIYAMSHYSVFGSIASANSIKFHRVAVRPASQAEIEARQAKIDLVTTNANVASNTSAIATETSARAAADTTLTASFTALRTAGDVKSLPGDFEADDLYWTISGTTFASVANVGRVAQQTAYNSVQHRGKMPLIPGHTYQMTFRYRISTDATNGYAPNPLAGAVLYNSAGLSTNSHWQVGFTPRYVADGWIEAKGSFTATYLLSLQADATYFQMHAETCWNGSGASNAIGQIRTLLVEDITDLAATNASVTEVKTAVADAGGAYSYYGLKLGAGNRFASIEALASSKTNVSQLKMTADKFTVQTATTDKQVFSVTGSLVEINTDLAVGGAISVGAARLKVALESILRTGADGASITWAGGANIGNIPEYVLDLSSLAPLTTGEAYNVYLTGVTATGATVYAKISTPGTTSTVTQTTDAAGGGGDPTRVMAKSDSADAYDGIYNFRVIGTVTVTGADIGGGLWLNTGSCSISTWFNDGGGWDEGPPITVDVNYESFSDETGSQGFDVTAPVTWANAIGAGSTYDFGVTADSGGTVTDLHTVSYLKQTSSGLRTASPAGQTVKVTAFPRNA